MFHSYLIFTLSSLRERKSPGNASVRSLTTPLTESCPRTAKQCLRICYRCTLDRVGSTVAFSCRTEEIQWNSMPQVCSVRLHLERFDSVRRSFRQRSPGARTRRLPRHPSASEFDRLRHRTASGRTNARPRTNRTRNPTRASTTLHLCSSDQTQRAVRMRNGVIGVDTVTKAR